MVLDVIHPIDKAAAVSLGDARIPALVPGSNGMGKRLVPLLPNVFGDLERAVDPCDCPLGVALGRGGLGGLQSSVDPPQIRQHLDVLTIELSNADVEFQVVPVELDSL